MYAYSWKTDHSFDAPDEPPECSCCGAALPALAIFDDDGGVWGRDCWARATGVPRKRGSAAQMKKRVSSARNWPEQLVVELGSTRGNGALTATIRAPGHATLSVGPLLGDHDDLRALAALVAADYIAALSAHFAKMLDMIADADEWAMRLPE